MILFTPWRRLEVQFDQPAIRRFLRAVGEESVKAFREGMDGAHSGAVAKRKNGSIFLRSTPAQFPANDSGRLRQTIRFRLGRDEVTVGTGMAYAKYLREGTKHMQRRRMSDDALQIGIRRSRTSLRGWVRWIRR